VSPDPKRTIEMRHRVALAGVVTDAVTSQSVADAVVSIANAPKAFESWLGVYATRFGAAWSGMTERPDRTRSRRDGLFYFLDLPDGDYELTVAAPSFGSRYGVAGSTVKVVGKELPRYEIQWTNVSLPPTTIQGCVSSKKINIGFAQVQIQGSGESVFSDDMGRYVLAGIEPGKRTLMVSAQGYKPFAEQIVIAKPGDRNTKDVQLIHSAG
jgi:hypothetical protein